MFKVNNRDTRTTSFKFLEKQNFFGKFNDQKVEKILTIFCCDDEFFIGCI